MDSFDPSALVVVLFSLFLTAIVHKRLSSNKTKLPPGSFGWPVIGETIDFLFSNPEKFVSDRMKKYSPDIFMTKIMGEKTAVICGPNGHKFLFSNEEKLFTAFRTHSMQKLFQSYQSNSSSSPSPSPSQSTRVMIRQPGFLKPEALTRYLGEMDLITQELLQSHWEGKNEIKTYPFAKFLTLTLACRFFLGTNNSERITKLVNYFDDITLGLHAMLLNFPGTAFYRANKAAIAVRRELIGVIKEKKEEMANGVKMQDILCHMIVVTDSKGKFMPENEIADKIMGLLVAGYSTVATTITFLMKYVGQRSDIYEKILIEQKEIAGAKKAGEVLEWEDMQKMKYSWNVICETMRLTPPLQGTFRQVLTDFTYAGYSIPKGWKVYWTASSTNKNPAYFQDPEEFDPSRYEKRDEPTPYTYVPFGGGPRMCPGKEYARLAILTFLHNVVMKYKWELLAPDEKVVGDMMPTPEKGLPIRLHQH
ncbi:beta-amyrin 28-monooxygenase-like [Nicotiana tabacum]|uniref:Beta-amyrin 28-monooxygenase-like n=2 Tax=Nicotiana TaxID=4085 RepID=A0A1S4DEK7_TOBAC|nr:PREDICTED: beta-amyrin 28-oxidase-like [Nicotiana sylvestris]XP_016511783.1 PREDICTED: beta-amyrin 28-oxidase-like [Nicotiana tabacum]